MKRYLIISLQGIGVLLLATPNSGTYKETDAESRVCVLTFKGNAEILKGNTDVDMAYMINNARTRDLPYILGMIWSLKKERFDASICAYPSGIRSALIGYLSGSKARIGQGLKIFDNYKWLFTSNARVEDVKHAVEMNLDLLAAYGMDINGAEKRPRIDISEADIAAAGAFLDENGISGKDMVIAVHSGGGIYTALYRCWPEERFSAVSDTLAEKYGAKVVIIGGKQDYGNASRVAGL
jgi:ADP-heptose:LPS heptosyltransferase